MNETGTSACHSEREKTSKLFDRNGQHWKPVPKVNKDLNDYDYDYDSNNVLLFYFYIIQS